MINMLGSFSQLEREIIQGADKAGISASRANGLKDGGKHILSERGRLK